jgi:hypothetical protein
LIDKRLDHRSWAGQRRTIKWAEEKPIEKWAKWEEEDSRDAKRGETTSLRLVKRLDGLEVGPENQKDLFACYSNGLSNGNRRKQHLEAKFILNGFLKINTYHHVFL